MKPARQPSSVGLWVQLGFVALFLWMIGEVAVPLLMGALFAVIFFPLASRFERLPRAKGWGPAAVVTLVMVVLVVPTSLLALKAGRAAASFFSADWNAISARAEDVIVRALGPMGGRVSVENHELQGMLRSVAVRVGSYAASFATQIGESVPEAVLGGFFFLVALYYALRDGDELIAWLKTLSPFSRERTEELLGSVQATVHATVMGVIVTALVQATLTLIALLIFGVPAPFALGAVALALSVIPMVGTVPVTLGATIYLVVEMRYGAAVGMAIAAVIIGLSDNVVRPWVQSAGGEMHPLVALLGLIGGLQLFGTAGIFLGPIVASLAVWAMKQHGDARLRELRQPPSP